jgi:glycogen operon protein
VYYTLAQNNRRYYQNYSGCGNMLNCNNPVVSRLILDCLEYWVVSMHVDGFRFDLGSILGRDRYGNLMENPPLIETIAEDPILRNTKLIAEAWDAGGAYQVGWFPGGRWAEWNDRYRDDVRRFWRGDKLAARNLATRLAGSSDLYLRDGRKPFHSINFITSHDGFTMRDLVSYNEKHNYENGEQNGDGNNQNYSFNHGFEGPVDNPEIAGLRMRLMKNFFTTLMISQGTPMILGGDEFGRTQAGNNNAYCQDSPISWFDWAQLERFGELERFVRELIAFRLRHTVFMRPEFYSGRDSPYNSIPDIRWYTSTLKAPDWESADKTLSFFMNGTRTAQLSDRDDFDFFIMLNGGSEPVMFSVPEPAGAQKKWYRKIDTGLPAPEDILGEGVIVPIDIQSKYPVKAYSVVVLATG